MGRHSGNLAMYVGIACGATATLIPEADIDFEKSVIEAMRNGRISGRNHHIIIVAEGYGHAQSVADRINEETGLEARVTVLGHVQRGGRPTCRDRVTATRFGTKAVDLLMEGKTNRVVCYQKHQITDIDIVEALNMQKQFHAELYDVMCRTAR